MSLPRNSALCSTSRSVRASAFSSPPLTSIARSNAQGKAFPGDAVLDTKESSLVVCFGEMLIDFVPTTNGLSLAEAPAFKKAAGGAPANVAVGIARLGGSSAFIGKVGEDEFGYMLADILKENNVNNEGMRFDPGARTALAFVTLRSDGEQAELDFDLIRKAKILHYGSISLITEPCKSAHIAAAKAAKEAEKEFVSIWETADIIKVSEEEISFLTEEKIHMMKLSFANCTIQI
ncbi:hypothetical protein M0R45_006529 [Rubus argutus]|uniref:Carbohydrate kinase PfkB domain-containing protein n=1 Tax=Rubus argutus TaxID=59490 RepID=A0AAW1YRD4_RUBAR